MRKGKFFIGSGLLLAAVIYLIVSSTQANAQFFMTVEELMAAPEKGQSRGVKVSGAVLGDSIQYDSQTLQLTFTVVHIPGDNKDIEAQGGLAEVLRVAVTDPGRAHLNVSYTGPKPDLLRAEAQAIMTGRLGEDGVFYAEELLLKCPTKYEEAVPDQVEK